MQTQMRLTAQPALVARGSRSQAPVCASSFMGSKLPAKGDSVAELRNSVRRSCAPAAVEVRTAAFPSAPGGLRAAAAPDGAFILRACGSRLTGGPAGGAGPAGFLQIWGRPLRARPRQSCWTGRRQGPAARLAVGRLLCE
jgi:hypothetical protein